tara:strand:- start:294 stop:695 length:402 start_codon:yes stop_codon:yes gene_type:complete
MFIRYLFIFIIASLALNAQNDLTNTQELNTSTASSKDLDNMKNKAERVDKWFAIDKLQHFSYSCLISLGCQYVLVNKQNNTEEESLPISSALSFTAGLLKELDDDRRENGFFSWKDMVANAAGIAVAAVIISN